VLVGCTGVPSQTAGGAPDLARAREQARTFHTMATRDQWANYGKQFTVFCERRFGFDCNREDRDVGSDLSSGQEIQQWDAEKNNPQSVVADIGILFIPQAEQAGILADYEPPNVDLLPDNLHGPGWVATFVGVPDMLINLDALEQRDIPVPDEWADLTDPVYEGLIGLNRVGISAGGTWAFVAMNLAAGGTLDDWQPGIEFGRRLLPNLGQSPSLEAFERGETPIAIRFDFSNASWLSTLDDHGVRYERVIPRDGSVYAPATLMLNRYDTAHHDFGKLFMEWVLTDEGQYLFARSGARPVRATLDENALDVPDEYRVNWLPDEAYQNVVSVDWEQIDSEEILRIWEEEVVGGGG
jgi:putative spermidine/putrescine transport system substrate-binding protein